jgi:inosine/xanthosine triphosphatase
MLITVGSKNPNKVQAVKEAFSLFQRFETAEFESFASESGVPDQPLGLDEILTGAKQRAVHAFSRCRLSVGLESGLIPVPQSQNGYMNVSACAIYDGSTHYTGLGPAFELPHAVVDLVIGKKLELDEAIFRSGLSTNPRIGYSEGIIGMLTDGVVTRKDYMVPAVTMALSGLFSKDLLKT